jgi:hypothetical protein
VVHLHAFAETAQRRAADSALRPVEKCPGGLLQQRGGMDMLRGHAFRDEQVPDGVVVAGAQARARSGQVGMEEDQPGLHLGGAQIDSRRDGERLAWITGVDLHAEPPEVDVGRAEVQPVGGGLSRPASDAGRFLGPRFVAGSHRTHQVQRRSLPAPDPGR